MSRFSPLACILYAGEPSLSRLIGSLESQEDVESRFVVIGNHPKHEAHARLFETLNTYRNEYDFSLFLGSDMEILEPRLLVSLGSVFERFARIDHVFFSVQDWYSGAPQLGVTAWRKGVRHGTSANALFTDRVQNSGRLRLKIEFPRTALIMHGDDPSERQAIRYGAQRALKAAATGKPSRWERLRDLIDYTEAHPDPSRMLSVASVELALTDREFGHRCISGDGAFDAADLERVRVTAASADLIRRARAMVTDEGLRETLSRARAEDAPEPSPRRRGRWRDRGREDDAGYREAAETAFYEALAG